MAVPNVSGTPTSSGRDDPNIHRDRRRRRIRLKRVDTVRMGQGAPAAAQANIFPHPFLGLWEHARHGHYPVYHVGVARRVGAFRAAGTGTLGGNRRANRSS
jgi:hypothetical protein